MAKCHAPLPSQLGSWGSGNGPWSCATAHVRKAFVSERSADDKARWLSTLQFVRARDPLLVEAVEDVDLSLLALTLSRSPTERLISASLAARGLARFRKVDPQEP